MARPRRRALLASAAVLVAAAPFLVATLRAVTSGGDLRMLWMAASGLLGTVTVAALGRRLAGRFGTTVTSLAILFVASLLSAFSGVALGATAGPGVWAVSAV
jgi:hypothetical protein